MRIAAVVLLVCKSGHRSFGPCAQRAECRRDVATPFDEQLDE